MNYEAIHEKFKPVIEFLLRTQNGDGSWGDPKPVLRGEANRSPWNYRPFSDRRRSAGAVNVLTWWYLNVAKDPRILSAVRKFDQFIDDPKLAADFGMLHRREGLDLDKGFKVVAHTDNDVATALTGLALADILSPGVGSNW